MGASRQGLGLSLHSGSRVLCVCMCACSCVCMYVHGEPVCKYVQGGISSQAGQVGRLRQGLLGVASSQVDSPQVSGRCDGVALRAELLGTLRGEWGRGRGPPVKPWATHLICEPGPAALPPCTSCVPGPHGLVCEGWGGLGGLCEQAGTLLCWGDARIKPPG